jgi:hypothetical protein
MGQTVRWHVHKDRSPLNEYERKHPWLVDVDGRRMRRVPSRDEAFSFIQSWYLARKALPKILQRWGWERE